MSYLSARTVNDKEYVAGDTNLKMDDDFYKYEVLPVNLTLTLIIGVLLPLFLIYKLLRGKKLI